MYITQIDERRVSRGRVAQRKSLARNLTVEAITDENQLAMLEYLESIGDDVMPYARGIAEGSGLDPQAFICDEMATMSGSGGM
jgi:hypothetical protein